MIALPAAPERIFTYYGVAPVEDKTWQHCWWETNTEYIRADLVPQWQPSDGCPCSMDVFVSKLFETCDDKYDRCDAINEWLHGDWDAAFCYLQDEDAEALRKDGAA